MSSGGWLRAVCVGIIASAGCGQASPPPAAVDADASPADVNTETSLPDAAPDKDARDAGDGKTVDAAAQPLGDAGSDRADALQEHAGNGPTDASLDQGASSGVVRAADGSWRLPSPADLRSIWGTGDSDVWAVGDHGTIVHWDGKTWSFAASNVAVSLFDVYGFGANDVWAVGAAGTSLHWNGSSWTADSSGAPALHAVWGVSAADVWAVGAGVIRHWDGSKWSSVAAPAVGTSALYDVWGPAADDVWTVGDAGAILHWDGKVWTARASGATNDLRCVVGRGGSAVWAVGFGNSSALWTGTDWLLQFIAQQPNDILAASGTSPSDRWFVGLQGWIRYFDGEFSNYVRATNPAAEDLTGVWANRTNDVWAVGTGGAILRWDSRLTTSYALRAARRSP